MSNGIAKGLVALKKQGSFLRMAGMPFNGHSHHFLHGSLYSVKAD